MSMTLFYLFDFPCKYFIIKSGDKMKSDQKKLEERGYISLRMLASFKQFTKEELLPFLKEKPSIRTSCIYYLSEKYHDEDDFTQILLKQLSHETALYTKIEIQNNLSLYGNISEMCEYLGKIGHNQHKIVPNKVSLKKSYPLPRDLIARSLAHMEAARYPEFLKAMKSLDEQQLQEGLDAFGFFCFYNATSIDKEAYEFVSQLVFKYKENELMTWKLATCLSAFPQSTNLLLKIKTEQKHPTIQKEVERSLQIIQFSNNH